jgi:hypothetical protein
VGRALVLNAPRSGLAAAVAQEPPDLLAGPVPRHRLHSLHLLVGRELIPEAMASRVILVADAARPAVGANGVTLRRLLSPEDPTQAHLVVSAVLEASEQDLAGREAEMIRAVTALMPFAEGRLVRVAEPHARWDDDSALEEPEAAEGWPGEIDIRVASKQPVYRLDRAAVAGLGFEGEILLGWRGGDAIAADLA